MADWSDGYYENAGWLRIPQVTVDGSGVPTGALTYLGQSVPVSGIALTDVWTAGGVRFDGTNFVDENSAIISGSPAVADQTALLALDAATYENFSVTVTSGLNRSTWTSNGTQFGPLNGQYVQERATVPGDIYIFPDNVTWTASDNGSGKVRLTASAAHGMTEANAEGSYLYLISGGTGWTAATSHRITPSTGYVSTTVVDLDTTYTASMGVPVFAKAGTVEANSEIPLKTITLPALRANTEVIVELSMEFSTDASTGNRRTKLYLSNTELYNASVSATNTMSIPYRFGFRNQNDASSQRGLSGYNTTGYANGTLGPATAAEATGTAGVAMTIRHMANVPGMTVRVGGYDVLIRG